MLLGFLLKVYYDKSRTEQTNRLAIEEVYHSLVVEANKIRSSVKIVTRTVEKPDGTKIVEKTESTKKSEESTKVSKQQVDKSIVATEERSKKASQYSATVLGPLQASPYDVNQIGVYFGYRIFGPIEVLIGGRPMERAAEVGVRIEF